MSKAELQRAFNRGRSDARSKSKSISSLPYSDKLKAAQWERGFHKERQNPREDQRRASHANNSMKSPSSR